MIKPFLFCFFLYCSLTAQWEKPSIRDEAYPSDQTQSAYDGDCDDTPIVLDLDGNGFIFSGPEHAVLFDLYDSGDPIKLQWVLGDDDAFLAHDLNGNGIVDNGSELFGSGTKYLLNSNRKSPNGFVALSQFDDPSLGGDDNGVLDAADEVWSELMVWLDRDHNGISTKDEILDLEMVGLTMLQTIPRFSYNEDQFHNKLKLWAWAFRGDIRNRIAMVDVYLRRVTSGKQNLHVSEPHFLKDGVTEMFNGPWIEEPFRKAPDLNQWGHIGEFFADRTEDHEALMAEWLERGKKGKTLPQGVVFTDKSLEIIGYYRSEMMALGIQFESMVGQMKSDREYIYHDLYDRGFPAEELPLLYERVSGENSFESYEKQLALDFKKFRGMELDVDRRVQRVDQWMTMVFDGLSAKAQRVLISYLTHSFIPYSALFILHAQ